ncbi:MAG: hypothetical protein M5U28_45215 [Sandaracinaceae bacterium]|nr:hypothetical protein [Sandaracinaceae bacterium]
MRRARQGARPPRGDRARVGGGRGRARPARDGAGRCGQVAPPARARRARGGRRGRALRTRRPGGGRLLARPRPPARAGAAELRESDPVGAQHEALRAHLAQLFAADVLDRAAEALGELALAPAPRPSAMAQADARTRAAWMRGAFVEWLSAACEERPHLLVLEDLHWAERGSVVAIEEAIAKSAGRALCVLALARPEVHELFGELWAKVGVQEVRLVPLTRRACERLIRTVLPDAGADRVEHVIERAEGNAFCLEELIRHVAHDAAAPLPETVLALAEARVARLRPEHRRVLRAGSVLGEVLWDAGVAAILEDELGDVRASCASWWPTRSWSSTRRAASPVRASTRSATRCCATPSTRRSPTTTASSRTAARRSGCSPRASVIRRCSPRTSSARASRRAPSCTSRARPSARSTRSTGRRVARSPRARCGSEARRPCAARST